jgi:hypothetical protein
MRREHFVCDGGVEWEALVSEAVGHLSSPEMVGTV